MGGMRSDPVQMADGEARALALRLMAEARVAALAYADPADGLPAISRIAFGLDADGVPVTLVSSLAAHSPGLVAQPLCSVMLGEVGDRGDPLTHPRLMLRVRAEPVAADAPGRAELRAHWLKGHPKAALYVDFADFRFVRLVPLSGLLNGGFGKAFRQGPEDLRA